MTKEGFAAQIEQLQGRLYRVALCMLKNDADVQDALQETVLRAWEKRYMLRNEAYFGTWVTRIAINVCKQMCRQKRRIVLMDELPETPATSDGITLKMLIESLPEKLRLPFVLYYSEGMETAEVANALHLTAAAVRSRIHRAKIILRKELVDHEEQPMASR